MEDDIFDADIATQIALLHSLLPVQPESEPETLAYGSPVSPPKEVPLENPQPKSSAAASDAWWRSENARLNQVDENTGLGPSRPSATGVTEPALHHAGASAAASSAADFFTAPMSAPGMVFGQHPAVFVQPAMFVAQQTCPVPPEASGSSSSTAPFLPCAGGSAGVSSAEGGVGLPTTFAAGEVIPEWSNEDWGAAEWAV